MTTNSWYNKGDKEIPDIVVMTINPDITDIRINFPYNREEHEF